MVFWIFTIAPELGADHAPARGTYSEYVKCWFSRFIGALPVCLLVACVYICIVSVGIVCICDV